ncbi:MAG: DUF4097 family beta strand repeat-containing protein [Bacteroidota bacterium]
MGKICVVFGFLCCHFACAQKIVKKTIIDHHTSFVQIEAANCFEITMQTSKTKEMVVEATIDGEYKKDLLLNIGKKGTTAIVNTSFQPNFIDPNDKLSAHKVIAIALNITIPENRNVQVYGTSCNVTATGLYKNLDIRLDDGMCTLNNVGYEIKVATQSGDIHARSSAADIDRSSKYGKIFEEVIPYGENHFELNTVTGDIHLMKIK